MLHKEMDQIETFRQETYVKKHEELEKRIEALESQVIAKKELEKRRARFYLAMGAIVAAITVLILFTDQVVIDHILGG